MALKPIHLWSHESGPNPRRVTIILEELGLPYETEFVDFAVIHTPVFEKINPNGRVPAIHDPNTGITLWESGAIILYLLETYDTENKLQPSGTAEKFQAQQWLFFQTSGQGPYFGNYVWFTVYLKIPDAAERFFKEIIRVTKVLDGVLEGKEYLVGDKVTYADLSFVTWYNTFAAFPGFPSSLSHAELKASHPNFGRWMDKLLVRPAVVKVIGDGAKGNGEH